MALKTAADSSEVLGSRVVLNGETGSLPSVKRYEKKRKNGCKEKENRIINSAGKVMLTLDF